MIIGIIGKSGSGKNYVSYYLERKGYKHLDLDKFGHQSLEENKDELVKEFGTTILDFHNKVNRKVLSDIVFSSIEKLYKLEKISLKWIEEKVKESISEKCIINGANLYKSELYSLCDIIIWVECPLIIRILRLLKRDDRSLFNILKRIHKQRYIKKPLDNKTFVLYNYGKYSIKDQIGVVL